MAYTQLSTCYALAELKGAELDSLEEEAEEEKE